MTVASIAAEVVFCAGWIAVGAAAAYSRYKKALELGSGIGATREYHKGLYFGRAAMPEGAAPKTEWKAPEKPGVSGMDREAVASAGLASLAQALEDAQVKVQVKEERAAVP
jgi:hypothetical protein